MGNFLQSMEWFNNLISCVPTDPGILARIGEMFLRENDSAQAFQSYSESFRYFPSNLGVLSWLGSYYVECEIYDQARITFYIKKIFLVQFFERAATIQPSEPKWQLLIASCHRRQGSYQKAYDTYKTINEKFPDNVECLRFLVRISTDLGIKDVHDYIQKLSKAEKGSIPDGVEMPNVDTIPSHLRHQQKVNTRGDEENWNDEDVAFLLP
jgi:intraflagellar transport protein 88